MAWRILALAIACAGCSRLLGIDDLHPSADAGGDAPAADAPPCTPNVLPATLLSDTMLLDAGGNPNPSIRYGGNDTINLGQSGTSRLLLRFGLTQPTVDALVAGTGTITAELVVTLRGSGGACGGACPNAATAFDVFAATDGWNEGDGSPYAGAAWFQRIGISSSNQTMWQAAGADGASDHNPTLLAAVSVTPAQAGAAGPIAIPFFVDNSIRTALLAEVSAGHLSLLLAPTTGGTLFAMARESGTSSQLTFSVCP